MAKVVTSKMLMALQSEVTSKTLEVEAVKKDLSKETDAEIMDRLPLFFLLVLWLLTNGEKPNFFAYPFKSYWFAILDW